MIKKWCRYWSLMLVSLSGCIHQQDYQIKQTKQTQAPTPTDTPAQESCTKQHEPTLTIWIHGTRTSKAILQNFFRSIPGLHTVDDYNSSNNQYTVAHALNDASPQDFPLDRLLLFGWSGKLSHTARQEAAEKLYADILAFLDAYEKKHGIRLRVRIITHSHGGNVALLMHEAASTHKQKLVIDELIMLACPVQRATTSYTKDPMFKTILTIFSPSDLIQVVDPQGLYEFKGIIFEGQIPPNKRDRSLFSHRRFSGQDNLIQLKVKRHGHGLSHLSFILRPFLLSLPHVLDHVETVREAGVTTVNRFKCNGFDFKPPTRIP